MDIRVSALVGIIITCFVVLAALVVGQEYLGTRVIGAGQPRERIRLGEEFTVQFSTSATAPAVQIAVCQDNPAAMEVCQIVAPRVTGTQAPVRFPEVFPLGKALVKVSNIGPTGGLGDVQFTQSIVVAP